MLKQRRNESHQLGILKWLPGFELTYCILQFAIHLREPMIRKNVKTNKIAI